MPEQNKRTDASIRSKALAWYVEKLDAELSPEQSVEFEAWLAADPAHEREYRQLDLLCDELGAFEDAPQIEQAKTYAVQYRERAQSQEDRVQANAPRRRWLAAAASIVLMISAWSLMKGTDFVSAPDRYATERGEQRLVELADGSTINLNTQSAIDVTYSEDQRQIHLHVGQASFKVASDRERPFEVVAGNGIVTAVGTAFDVYRTDDDVRVTLLEGIVKVRSRGASSTLPKPEESDEQTAAANPAEKSPTEALPLGPQGADGSTKYEVAELRPGQQISIGQAGSLSKIAKIDVDRVTAWTYGNIDFENTPLHDAIAEVNRYSRTQLVLANATVANVEVSGIFKIGRPENFVRALEARFGLKSQRNSDGQILLTSPPTN